MLKTSFRILGLAIGLYFSATVVALGSGNVVVAELKLQGSNNSLIQRNESFSADRVRILDEFYTLLAAPDVQTLLRRANFTLSNTADTVSNYTLKLNAASVVLPDDMATDLADFAELPPEISDITLSASVDLSDTWGLLQAQARSIWITGIQLNSVALQWDEYSATATGDLSVTQDGLATGFVEINVTNWQQALATVKFEEGGQARAIENFVAGFAEGDTLTLPLEILDGNVSLGPFVFWTLPPLVLP